MAGSGWRLVKLAFWCWLWTVVVCDAVLVAVTALSPGQADDYGLLGTALIFGVNLVIDPVSMWRGFQPSFSEPVACVLFYGSVATGLLLGWGTASLSWCDGVRVRRP